MNQQTADFQVASHSACWKHIGSFAKNRECKRLLDVIHCSHCEIYQLAAHALLDCPSDEKSVDRWTEQLAVIPEQEKNQLISIVIFQLGNEWFGLPTERVGTGSKDCRWRRIPHRSGTEFLGIMAVRGELVLCFSLHSLLGMEYATPDTCSQVLVCGEENRRLAFPVQKIGGERLVGLTAANKPPATISRTSNTYTHALVETEGCSVAILDADRLFRAMEAKAR